jgi:hypothetical protein
MGRSVAPRRSARPRITRAMRVDVRDHHLARRSSAAFAKYADAVFRISLARFGLKFSRSSYFRRARSSVRVRPARLPPSRSTWRTTPQRFDDASELIGDGSIVAH